MRRRRGHFTVFNAIKGLAFAKQRTLTWLAMLGVMKIFFLGSLAHASSYCVDTTANNAIAFCTSAPGDCSLRGAIANANGGAEGSVQDIRVPAGTYLVPGGLLFDPAGDRDNKDFSITGGWNAACTVRTTNPANTILNADNGAIDGPFEFSGDQLRIQVEGLTLQNFSSLVISDSLCAPFNSCPDTLEIRFRHNIVRDGIQVLILAADAKQFSVSNNLFASLAVASTPVVVIDYSSAESMPQIAFNTFANLNCGSSGEAAVAMFSNWPGTVIHHNIVQSQSCSADLHLSGPANITAMTLRNNLYATLGGQTPSAQSGNVITTIPGFINPTNDFRLRETAPASAAINAGMTPVQAAQFGLSIPSQDLDGPSGARVIGQRVDIGAFESSINDASVLVVSNTNDAGSGSLRQALISANANPGKQMIEFNMGAGCPREILLLSPLPAVIDDVEINGYSQPGSSVNTQSDGSDAQLCVILNAAAGTLANFLSVPQAAAASTSLIVKGLAFGGASAATGSATVQVALLGGSDHVLQGNAFGGIGPGTLGNLGAPVIGIQIAGVAQNALAGGPDVEQRNSFAGMSVAGIYVLGASSGNAFGHTIQNNTFGLTGNGLNANSIGPPGGSAGNAILADNTPNLEIFDNVIAAVPNDAAIRIQGVNATGYSVRANRIGTNAINIPSVALRVATGISLSAGAHDNAIGSGTSGSQSNTISNTTGPGIWIKSDAGNGNLARPNKIFATGILGTGLGLDIGELGQLANDVGDGDNGPNRSQNWPSVTQSSANANGTRQVNAVLGSVAAADFRIDIYRSIDCPGANPSNATGGNTAQLVGSGVVTTDATFGVAQYNAMLSGAGAPGFLTATATRVSTGDTSEVGACFKEPDTLFANGFE